jgi:enterochelin esterase-like enzyme
MRTNHEVIRAFHILMAAAALALWLAPGSRAAPAWAQGAIISPGVIHTGPTGYEVTFRYYAPNAVRVRIRGEWYFSDAAHTTLHSSAGWLPAQWIPGAFPIAYPNNAYEPNWPALDMSLDPATEIWSFTTPMPSGTYTYGFCIDYDAPAPALPGCTEVADPNNPPWNTSGAVESTSQVYVPSDPNFGTVDYSWQAPNPKHGTLEDVTYDSPLSTDPPGKHYLAVYLPPDYNAKRATPYPTLYQSHGGGGNEIDWSTQGVANRILDNLIAAGKVQPMVAVMTNFNDLGDGNVFDPTAYREDLLYNVIPYVEAHYNVSHNANDRAFGGLSLGGLRANDLLFNATTAFGYYASWSIAALGAPPVGDARWQNPDLKTRLGIQIGGGLFDWLTVPGIDDYEATFMANGIPFVNDTIDGGHEWYVWRQMLYDFAATMAFKHTTTTLSQVVAPESAGGRDVIFVTATIKADTTEPARLTGKVQFYLDGQKLNPARPLLPDGSAKQALPQLSPGAHTVTAVYSGDNFYNTSTSAALTVSPWTPLNEHQEELFKKKGEAVAIHAVWRG